MRTLNEAFGHALRKLRQDKELTQYDFPPHVSREYMSMLERGLRSPSLDMIDLLARKLGIHPLTLIAQCYLSQSPAPDLNQLLATVKKEARLDLH